MRLRPRQVAILKFVAEFRQVTRKQIRSGVFTTSSATPCDREVSRLLDRRLIERINIPTTPGALGGRQPDVYQIGPAGWKAAAMDGAYYLSRSIKYHSLAICDTYLRVYHSQSDELRIIRYETEPDSHVKINYAALEPDLYMEFMTARGVLRVWFEIDLGTERPRQLKDKMARYHHALQGASEKWNPWPFVIWVVPDEKRRAELESLIKLEPADSRGMYRVCLFEDVVKTLSQ